MCLRAASGQVNGSLPEEDLLRLPLRHLIFCLLCQNEKMPGEEKPAASFENGLQELEKIVKEMEGADLPLERALELFEKGMRLSEACRKQLEEAETRIEVLIRKGSKIQAEPFQPDKA
jgi:exodeoxyribonuclease VII small subunit